MAIYTNETIPDQWGLPVGYSSAWMLPRKAGYIVAFSENSIGGTGNAVMGVNGSGTFTITLSTGAELSLVVSSSGICEATLTMTGGAVGALYANGISDINLSATGTLGAVAFSTGNGTITLTASADIKALGQMTGSMSPFTELSPQGLAQAVWNSLATEYNTLGTMGAKLNTASSGGVDMNALAQAVWEYGMRSLTESAGLTTEQSEQLSRIDTRVDIPVSDSIGSYGRQVIDYSRIDKKIEETFEDIKKDIQDIQPTDITDIVSELESIKKTIIEKTKKVEIKKIDFKQETDKIMELLKNQEQREEIKEKKEKEKEEKKRMKQEKEQKEILETLEEIESKISERKEIEDEIDKEEINNILKLLK